MCVSVCGPFSCCVLTIICILHSLLSPHLACWASLNVPSVGTSARGCTPPRHFHLSRSLSGGRGCDFLSLNLCLCPPLLCIIFVSLLSFSTCVLGLCRFQVLSCTFCPSLPVSLSLSLCLPFTVSGPLCASLTLCLSFLSVPSLSPSSSTSLSVSFSIYLHLVIPISLPLSLLYPSLLPFPHLILLKDLQRNQPLVPPVSRLQSRMAGKKLRPPSLGAPPQLRAPPAQDSLLPPRSQQPRWPPSDKTYLLPQGRPELA